MTYSRVAVLPSGRRTVSRKACRKRPLRISSLATFSSIRWRSFMSPMLALALDQVTPDEAGKSEGDEERGRDGVELPPLRCDLPRAPLERDAQQPDSKVEHHQFSKAHADRLARAQRHDGEDAVAHEGQVRRDEGGDDHDPDGN